MKTKQSLVIGLLVAGSAVILSGLGIGPSYALRQDQVENRSDYAKAYTPSSAKISEVESAGKVLNNQQGPTPPPVNRATTPSGSFGTHHGRH